jgi:hypothetical protein
MYFQESIMKAKKMMNKRTVQIVLALLGCVLCVGAANAQTPIVNEEAKLLSSDGEAYTNFGNSVAIDGNLALIGAYRDNGNGSNSGSAYLYRFDGSSWQEEAKLLASDGASNDSFGFSVAVSGNLALIGAVYDDDNGSNSGSAYIFRFDGKVWQEEAKLLASDGASEDNFGRSVSIDGNLALVGAYWDDDNGSNSGSAYIFNFGSCEGDINGDGNVGVGDILVTIEQWGPCSNCDADINGDGEVNVIDLLAIVGAWGPCE